MWYSAPLTVCVWKAKFTHIHTREIPRPVRWMLVYDGGGRRSREPPPPPPPPCFVRLFSDFFLASRAHARNPFWGHYKHLYYTYIGERGCGFGNIPGKPQQQHYSIHVHTIARQIRSPYWSSLLYRRGYIYSRVQWRERERVHLALTWPLYVCVYIKPPRFRGPHPPSLLWPTHTHTDRESGPKTTLSPTLRSLPIHLGVVVSLLLLLATAAAQRRDPSNHSTPR